jgi:hypothetical protein
MRRLTDKDAEPLRKQAAQKTVGLENVARKWKETAWTRQQDDFCKSLHTTTPHDSVPGIEAVDSPRKCHTSLRAGMVIRLLIRRGTVVQSPPTSLSR